VTLLWLVSFAELGRADSTAVIVSAGSSTADFIDVDTATVLASVTFEDRASVPLTLAATLDESTAVVVGFTGYVSFIDLVGMQYAGTLPLLAGPEQHGITLQPNEFGGVAITPDGATALITEGNEQGQLFFVDIATGTLSGSPIDMGDGPERIIITSDGTTAYALEENILYVIDVVARTFTSIVLPLPGELGGFALTPDESRALFTDSDNMVYLLETGTWTSLDSLEVDPSRFTEARDIAVSPDGALAIVANTTDQSITFVTVGASALGEDATIDVNGTPSAVAFSPDGNTAVVTLSNTSLVQIIDVLDRSVQATVTGQHGLAPFDVVVLPEPGQLLLLGFGIPGLLVIGRRRIRV
jgi:DNA-binding beta-propeller fold protein YncE